MDKGDKPESAGQAQTPHAHHASQQVPWRRQYRRPQAETAIGGLQVQPQAQQARFDWKVQLAHQGKGFGVGAQQYVLAVIDGGIQARRMEAARATAGDAGGFEHDRVMALTLEPEGRTESCPARPDNGYFH
ncbi:hypothetical protein GCM10027278_40210 [Paralcaligenes ginsengisoli]